MRTIIVVLLALLLPVAAFGAGAASSCTPSDLNVSGVYFVTCTYTADDTNGSIPVAAFDAEGYVMLAEVYTGATQPTALYDITVTRAIGSDTTDIFGGNLQNLSQAGGEQAPPKVGNSDGYPRYADGTLTVSWANNAVNSATGGIRITIAK